MSFPKYPRYKDSGVEWLGEVPEHWSRCTIKRLTDVITDGAHISPETENGTYPFVSTKDITRDSIDFENSLHTSPETYELMARTGCQPKWGDVLFSKDGTIGRTVVVRDHRKFAVASSLIIIRPDPQLLDVNFLNLLCQSAVVTNQVEAYVKGAGLPRLSVTNLTRLISCFPPLAEQKIIARFLDDQTQKIDSLISEQQRLIELLKEKRQAVISHAVTRGLNPDAPMKPSGVEWLGDVPAHWEGAALKRVAEVRTGVAKGKEHGTRATVSVPYLRVANVQDGYLDLTHVSTMEIPVDELDRFKLRTGDVLMNEGGDFDKLGRGHVWEGQIDPCITQNHVFAVRPKGVSPAWLSMLTSSSYAQFYFMGRSKQSTNLASISSTNLMELPVPLPPAPEQEEILAFLQRQMTASDALVSEAERAISLLQERRTALISAAVTGKIDVRGIAMAEAA